MDSLVRRTITKPTAATATSSKCASIGRRTDERDLFVDTAPAQRLQGIYLQPDEPLVADGKFTTLFFSKEVPRPPDIVQRLAKQLELENIGLTLVPKKGERAQFGCSARIRHTLAPDNSSLTFSSKTRFA